VRRILSPQPHIRDSTRFAQITAAPYPHPPCPLMPPASNLPTSNKLNPSTTTGTR
jgi:hypothetical protein